MNWVKSVVGDDLETDKLFFTKVEI
jgi:hypothetical protein